MLIGQLDLLEFVQCDSCGPGEEGALRLVDAATGEPSLSDEGVLEVFHAGAWGTFCASTVDFRPSDFEDPPALTESSASVACQQLGFTFGEFAPVLDEAAASTLRPPWLGRLRCRGTEQSVLECGDPPFGDTSGCGTIQRLQCYNRDPAGPARGDVRLVGGRSDPGGAWAYGRVEIYDGSFFNPVYDALDDSPSFGRRAAQVACRSLGFQSGAQMRAGSLSALPAPDAPDFRDEGADVVVVCNGDEPSIAECEIVRRQFMENFYDIPSDVTVALVCSNPTGCEVNDTAPVQGDLRLVNIFGVNSTSGPCDDVHFGGVEIFNQGRWGRICRDNDLFFVGSADFTVDAKVMCRQLGFPFSGQYAAGQPSEFDAAIARFVTVEDRSPNPEPLVWATDVRCTGTETRLEDCFTPQLDGPPPFSNCGDGTSDSGFFGVVCRRFEIPESGLIR
eukprot:jgi/Ulvmu1/5444/UM223_0005.1